VFGRAWGDWEALKSRIEDEMGVQVPCEGAALPESFISRLLWVRWLLSCLIWDWIQMKGRAFGRRLINTPIFQLVLEKLKIHAIALMEIVK